MDKGRITNEEGRAFAEWLDPHVPLDEVKFRGISAEHYDDKIIAGVLNYVDNKWGDNVPEYCVPALRSIIVEVPQDNFDNLPANIAKVSEGLVKIKNEKLKSFVDIQIRKFLEGVMEFLEENYVSSQPAVDE